MLRKKALRKIIITTFSIITIFVICIIPDKLNSDSNYLDTKIDTIYVGNDMTNDIYLLGPNGYLVKTSVVVTKDSLEDKVKEIINYLIIDNSKIPDGLTGVIPTGTKLNNTNIDKKIVTLDFSNTLLNTTKDLEERTIEAIVYSLINIDGIEGITIKIDGELLKLLPQNKKIIPDVLNRSYGINKVFEINNYNNIEKVVLYYIDNINNNKYYVPVTKYINDDRDKIKIIIENLSSNYIYESSLISLLKSNTELINYEIEDKIMTLNFNNEIFTNDKLLEEVTYPISMSVFDNYDVDSIIFKVEGENIYTYQKCCGIKES